MSWMLEGRTTWCVDASCAGRVRVAHATFTAHLSVQEATLRERPAQVHVIERCTMNDLSCLDVRVLLFMVCLCTTAALSRIGAVGWHALRGIIRRTVTINKPVYTMMHPKRELSEQTCRSTLTVQLNLGQASYFTLFSAALHLL
jgi:hypothetical protein